jgi:DNA-binding protein HU-alpha
MSDEAEPAGEAAGKAAKAPALTRKALIERVQAKSGAKAKDVRTIVEAALEVMADAVKAGEPLRLPPFGVGKSRAAAEGSEGKSTKTVLKTSTKPPKPPKPKAPKPAKAEKAAKPAKPAKGPKPDKAARQAKKKANEALATAGASE